jgi:hypothetical protein
MEVIARFGGFEYTVYQIAGSDADVGLPLECQYGSLRRLCSRDRMMRPLSQAVVIRGSSRLRQLLLPRRCPSNVEWMQG